MGPIEAASNSLLLKILESHFLLFVLRNYSRLRQLNFLCSLRRYYSNSITDAKKKSMYVLRYIFV